MDAARNEPDLAMAEVSGAILVGGGSRRMGVPKAVLRVPEDGPTMLERVAAVLKQCCDDVMLVGRLPAPIPESLRTLDGFDDAGQGPLSGLAAALKVSKHTRVMLAGCDMPFLSAEVVRMIISRSKETGVGVVPEIADSGNSVRLQPLHAVYLKSQLTTVERILEEGVRSMATATAELGMATLRFDANTAGEEVAWSFFNVNTPADLAAARKHASDLPGGTQGAILRANNLDRRE